ncbi:MAG TPA: MarR family transcriptional regulator [Acidimicrobiales bacterium]|nr:MarR family transcriptional regulator [Acidimicrobiales bacterium]
MDERPASRGCGEGACEVRSVDLRTLDEQSGRRYLVAQTARFAGAFLRWVDTHSSEGLSYPRLRLLEALHCSGSAIMRELADQLGMTPRHMTAVVDSLEKAGLTVRRPHPTDRRATLVELTPDGVAAAETALAPGLDAMAQVFDAVTLEEQQEYLEVITRLFGAMRSGAPCD